MCSFGAMSSGTNKSILLTQRFYKIDVISSFFELNQACGISLIIAVDRLTGPIVQAFTLKV